MDIRRAPLPRLRARRVGGAYGGKLLHQSPTAVVAAVAAKQMGVPVHVHNERVDDMVSTGGRAPLPATWSAAVEPTSVSQPSGARVFAWYRGRPYARRGWCAFEAGASRELVARAAFFPQAPE